MCLCVCVCVCVCVAETNGALTEEEDRNEGTV